MTRINAGVYDNYTLPFLAAGGISEANIRGHNHRVSDMVAGAVIGTGIGELALNNYENHLDERNNMMFMPLISNDTIGFWFSMAF